MRLDMTGYGLTCAFPGLALANLRELRQLYLGDNMLSVGSDRCSTGTALTATGSRCCDGTHVSSYAPRLHIPSKAVGQCRARLAMLRTRCRAAHCLSSGCPGTAYTAAWTETQAWRCAAWRASHLLCWMQQATPSAGPFLHACLAQVMAWLLDLGFCKCTSLQPMVCMSIASVVDARC